MSKKEGDHGQMLQRSQEDKSLKCLLDLPVSTLILIPAFWHPAYSSSSNPNSTSSVKPSLTPTFHPSTDRDEPSLLCKACAGPSPKSYFSGTEGCGALRMEGKLMLILCTAVRQNWLAGLRRPRGILVKGVSLGDRGPGFDSQLCSLLGV